MDTDLEMDLERIVINFKSDIKEITVSSTKSKEDFEESCDLLLSNYRDKIRESVIYFSSKKETYQGNLDSSLQYFVQCLHIKEKHIRTRILE